MPPSVSGYRGVPPGGRAMNVMAPIALVTASYGTIDGAISDFESVWASREDGGFHHTSLAVLTKDAEGRLQVGRNNSTAKHLEGAAPCSGAPCTCSRHPPA